jgi:hypothetical protein
MELSGTQRKIAFCVIVLVLVALGFYILDPAARGASQPGAQHPASSRSAHSSVPDATPSRSQSPAPGPTTASASHFANIYRWLPFSPAGLTSAASVVTRFADAYGTFSYTQSGRSYLGSLRPLVSAQLGAQIEGAFVTPGVAAQRAKLKQVSAGSSSINSLRAFGPSSLTFIVTMTEHITQVGGSNVQSAQYAITVTGSGSSWQVTSVELASEGNS